MMATNQPVAKQFAIKQWLMYTYEKTGIWRSLMGMWMAMGFRRRVLEERCDYAPQARPWLSRHGIDPPEEALVAMREIER
jgi:hypothetical protein